MRRTFENVLPLTLIAVSFPAVGFFVGWCVGNSQTPVVATLIPLAVGLLGAVGYGTLERRAAVMKLTEAMTKLQEKQEILVGAQSKLGSELGEWAESSYWLPAFLATGAMFFCFAAFGGIQLGIKARLPEPCPALSELMQDKEALDTPTPEEFSELHRIRLILISARVPGSDIRALFDTAIRPQFVAEHTGRSEAKAAEPEGSKGVAPLRETRKGFLRDLADGLERKVKFPEDGEKGTRKEEQ